MLKYTYIKFLVRLHGEYNILVKLNKFTWCFHKLSKYIHILQACGTNLIIDFIDFTDRLVLSSVVIHQGDNH